MTKTYTISDILGHLVYVAKEEGERVYAHEASPKIGLSMVCLLSEGCDVIYDNPARMSPITGFQFKHKPYKLKDVRYRHLSTDLSLEIKDISNNPKLYNALRNIIINHDGVSCGAILKSLKAYKYHKEEVLRLHKEEASEHYFPLWSKLNLAEWCKDEKFISSLSNELPITDKDEYAAVIKYYTLRFNEEKKFTRSEINRLRKLSDARLSAYGDFGVYYSNKEGL